MDAFELREEAHPAQPPCVTPVITSQPFQFLSLPREIRDAIYHHPLNKPHPSSILDLAGTCYIERKKSGSYWGTEKSTRLFRVNRQVSHEALKIFYSSFPFQFTQCIDTTIVNAVFRNTLPARHRGFISRVRFRISVRSVPGPSTISDDDNVRHALQTLVPLLPGVRRADLWLTIRGHQVPEYQIRGSYGENCGSTCRFLQLHPSGPRCPGFSATPLHGKDM